MRQTIRLGGNTFRDAVLYPAADFAPGVLPAGDLGRLLPEYNDGRARRMLDADTSLTYGAAYLANAWRVSGGNPDRAVSLYSGGYYYEAKRKGMLPRLIKGVPAK